MSSYVVYKGKVPGVYDDWEECHRHVHRFSGNSYKGYTTRAEAEARYARCLAGERRERMRNRSSLLCDGSLDDRYRLCNVTTNSANMMNFANVSRPKLG